YDSAAALLRGMTRDGFVAPHAAVRPPLFQTAAEGDPVAVSVVLSVGRGLGLLATDLMRKFALTGTAPYMGASGSLFTKTGPLLFETFKSVVHEADGRARVKLNDRPPVAGAVRAALDSRGIETTGHWERTSSTYEGALDA